MTTHALTPTTLYSCPVCGFSTPSPAQRLAHLRTQHGEEVAPHGYRLYAKYLRRAQVAFGKRAALKRLRELNGEAQHV